MALDQIDVDNYDPNAGEREMSFFEHLEQLRWHIIRAFVVVFVMGMVCFLMGQWMFDYIYLAPARPGFITYELFCDFSHFIGMGDRLCFSPKEFEIIATDLGELFLTHIKVSFIFGFVLAFPYVFWEVWRFISPALYEKERKNVRGIVAICSMLFLAGVAFGYFIISPFAITFLTNYDLGNVEPKIKLGSILNYMVMFTLPTGMVFELPVVSYFLTKVGILTPEFMRKYRRHAIVLILLLAAIITPPDITSQILIAIPLVILYEISITVSERVIKKEKKKEQLVAKNQ